LYPTYGEARDAVKALGIKTAAEYIVRYKEDPRLPGNPVTKYQGTFVSWPDFLGSGRISNQERSVQLYATYDEARDAARALGITSNNEYKNRYKEDPRLPGLPSGKYPDEFVSWPDFLGTENISTMERSDQLYATYDEARGAARALGIKTRLEYLSRYSENPRLPANPPSKFRGTFVSWSDYLGSGRISNQERSVQLYATYDEARNAARALGLKSIHEYNARYKEDSRLPRNPNMKYGRDFVSWPDFLGTKNISMKERSGQFYATYDEARDAARALGIKTSTEYVERYQEDPRLPRDVGRKYGQAFTGWGDFLGTGNAPAVKRKPGEIYSSFDEARTAARALGFRTAAEYIQRYKEDPRLPSNPQLKYRSDFKGWADFLGTIEDVAA